MPNRKNVSVLWFRRDLRFHDNTALLHALEDDFPILPIFIFDKHILDKLEDKSDARVSFILDQITTLKAKLEQQGSTIEIFFDTPENAFKNLSKDYDIKAVYTNRDYEPYAIRRDNRIKTLLNQQGISFFDFKDQVVFEGKEVLKQDGTPYKVFTPFKRLWLQKLESNQYYLGDVPIDFSKFVKTTSKPSPDLATLGFIASTIKIPSTSVATDIFRNYDKTRDFPALSGTSKLGIHFRFGTISIREYVFKTKKLNFTYLNELIWREFYSAILQQFPHVTERAFNKKYDLIPWRNDFTEFQKWCNGTTGYPIVDAGMRELNATGYMHNRVRMITASFLTKHLLIDWRWGEVYFAKKLLDFDLASNNGGWQWAAGTGTDAQPYFRVFNPESQTEKFDKHKTYITQWVPEWNSNSYPTPIVEHKSARLRAIETYKEAISK